MRNTEKHQKSMEFNDIAIEIDNLVKHFEDVKAVDGISFKIKKGECFGFLGPNGAGKTTTINIISCYMKPTSGKAKVNGYDVLKESSDVKKVIGIAPQENIFYEELTVYENVIFFGKMYPIDDSILRERAENLISKVGLENKRDTKSEKLSGGMKRRLNLIIGLVHDPDILFLDEPTAGLDPQSRRMLWDYLFELKGRNKTIFLTTHYMDEADVLSDRLAIIDHGKIIAQGTPEQLKETIGKGDLLSLKIEGPQSKILETIRDLKNKIDISDAEHLEEELIVRITAMDGLGKIGKITNHFLGEGLRVADATVQRNSLENVFLALTGRSLRE
ncbi:MAG: ABC transporter ATP-binding protein [Promethearchaeia archaeon]